MTNFSPSEFNVLWADVRIYVTKHWNVGSGRKSEVSARDLLLMLLTSLKHCGSWDVVAVTFKQHSPTFQKRTMSFVKALHPFLLRKYVTTVGEKYSMALLTTSGHQFANFPFVRYATDVTFQQTNVPSGSYAEKKTYFSGKHPSTAIKLKCPVSDKAIFDDNLEFHVSALSKQATEDRIADHGDEGTNQWAVIADKGYQGIQRVVRAVLPKKKPAGGILTLEDIRSNDRIASDRVIVENFFGRMKTLWAVCGETYRWSRDNYDVLFQTCMALTNVHIRLHPLRADDGEVY
ncbi:hypothetical protein DYB31_012287 [Aphanomyces astaci]|uniref:DDE Tnp4 domain-containing protein n=1 Tax=Aphanomyces astaci TaxID=112090 RepID=A0A397FDA5_APHAT|nr:hypothetical protein DYB31_012287 [Aphanomyces astaci]